MVTCIITALQLFDMGASGLGPVVKKAEMPKVLVDTEKGNEKVFSFLCLVFGLRAPYACTSA